MNNLKVNPTKLDRVFLITPPTMFEDFRGEYVELYNERLYKSAGIDVTFIEDDISVSARHVLRGIHGDASTWKLICCLYGRFYLVVLNNDRDSPQYGQWDAHVLSDKNRLQVLVPPKCGVGHLVLSHRAIFHYKQSSYYKRDEQFTVLWNDPRFNVWWPVKSPLVSRRDEMVV